MLNDGVLKNNYNFDSSLTNFSDLYHKHKDNINTISGLKKNTFICHILKEICRQFQSWNLSLKFARQIIWNMKKFLFSPPQLSVYKKSLSISTSSSLLISKTLICFQSNPLIYGRSLDDHIHDQQHNYSRADVRLNLFVMIYAVQIIGFVLPHYNPQ